MFLITWVFDKLGYMPKINVEVGKVEAWPFPAVSEDFNPRPKKNDSSPKKKPAAKKKPAVIAKTTRAKKAK
jgi:hypothetical protein